MCLVATEDELSEAVAMKLLVERKIDRQIITCLGRQGFGYLKKNLAKFSDAANNGRSVFMLTDLDKVACAPSLVADWFADRARPEGFLFRVAVREIETWLLADREAFARFLGISAGKVQRDIEDIMDPKQYLLHLAAGARRSVSNDLLPKKSALATQGSGYNQRLKEFVANHWSSARASESSPSLKKARQRLDIWVTDFLNSTKAT